MARRRLTISLNAAATVRQDISRDGHLNRVSIVNAQAISDLQGYCSDGDARRMIDSKRNSRCPVFN